VFIGYSPAAYYRRCCCYRRKIIAGVVYASDLFRIFIDSITPAIAGNNDTVDTLSPVSIIYCLMIFSFVRLSLT
jgi:hypothetical protein